MTEEHADETMVASMRADAERQGADDRKVTDAPHYLARVLMANGIRNMYGVVGIPSPISRASRRAWVCDSWACAMRRTL